jgi:hypothetical protein
LYSEVYCNISKYSYHIHNLYYLSSSSLFLVIFNLFHYSVCIHAYNVLWCYSSPAPYFALPPLSSYHAQKTFPFNIHVLFFLYVLYYAGWVYIVISTKVLIIYQIYHTWIHPLHRSPLFPCSRNSFNRYHFSFYIHVYTVFALYLPSYTLSLPPPPPIGTNSRQDLFCPPVLWFCKRKTKDIFVYLR